MPEPRSSSPKSKDEQGTASFLNARPHCTDRATLLNIESCTPDQCQHHHHSVRAMQSVPALTYSYSAIERPTFNFFAYTRKDGVLGLKKKVYEAYINRVNLVTTENVMIGQANSFHQQWGSSHEWTIRILCEKNAIDPEAALESDQFPRRLPPAKKSKKPKQPTKNRELCRSQFADWVFNNLDRNLTFHPPPYRWDEEPRTRPRNHEGRIMRDALNFDSDDDEEEEYIPLLPRVIPKGPSTSSRPAPPARDDHDPELERVRWLTGPSSSMVQEAAPAGQRRRALRAKNTGGTYLFINTASSPEASGTQDNVQTQEREGIGDFSLGAVAEDHDPDPWGHTA